MAQEKQKRRPTAEKRMIQNKKKRLLNRARKAQVGTAIRSLKKSLEEKQGQTAQEKLSSLYSLLDKGVKKGLLKKNKAARSKARLTALVKAMAT